ncbi:hypothetical protein Pcinc_035964 [Petrolisthes cinctipes]|uniref:Protein MIS12 homolog n=1 Tax=Petrolisthes cinctipes TaxID=88211 RepID=A0AAE1BX70_PETCI|nr:hypothetical protein Pcinc_035964 [Petrolisthes cinctipes]
MAPGGCELPNEEYEAQFLGFTPSMFLDGVERIIADRLSEALDQLEQHMSKVPVAVLPPNESHNGINTLRMEVDKHFTKTIQKFKVNARKTLMVPPPILHPADKEQANPASAVDITILETEIEKLQLQLKNEKFMQAKYKEELQEAEVVLHEQKEVLEGILAPHVVTNMEVAREKLLFIQTNQNEVEAAIERVKLATVHLPSHSDFTPDQIISNEVFQNDE